MTYDATMPLPIMPSQTSYGDPLEPTIPQETPRQLRQPPMYLANVPIHPSQPLVERQASSNLDDLLPTGKAYERETKQFFILFSCLIPFVFIVVLILIFKYSSF